MNPPPAGTGGQRQRVAIARAVLHRPSLLILDEATNALDPQAESAVREALDRAAARRTASVIAHRVGAVVGCDHVAVLDRGRIVEQGPPGELLAREGYLRAMVEWSGPEAAAAMRPPPLAVGP